MRNILPQAASTLSLMQVAKRHALLLGIVLIGFSGISLPANAHIPPADDASSPEETPKGLEILLEYSRGFSLPLTTSLRMAYGNNDLTFHDVYFEDESFFPDESPIPNAFLKPLGNLDLVDAVKSFTEPYYGIRFFFFLEPTDNWGFGIDFIHLKFFLRNFDQSIRVSGTEDGEPIDEVARIGDRFSYFSISHGVNQLGFSLMYRFLNLFPETPYLESLRPFVAISAGPCIPHTEITLVNKNKEKKRVAYSFQLGFPNLGLGATAGVRYRYSQNIGFFTEYKFTYSYLHGLYFDDDRNAAVELDFFEHHVQWGLTVVL